MTCKHYMAKLISMIKIHASWIPLLEDEFQQDYMLKLNDFLKDVRKKYIIYPPSDQVFSAFNLTSFDNLKVVIIGQDPYHGASQAHGLAFSVHNDILTPSLRNIFKEYMSDLHLPMPTTTDLTPWAKQGVFLINTSLTVQKGLANSHKNMGWEGFIDKVIKIISHNKKHVVFILWGANAQKKEYLIDLDKHLVLKSVHPSPLSVYRGFFNSKPFSKTNHYLKSKGITPINWHLT